MGKKNKALPKIGFIYLDYVLRFFDKSNFNRWPNKIEHVVYHWGNDKKRFIDEIKRKKIDILVGNIPATAYESFREIADALPHVRFVPSIESQFPNKSKENVTLFCNKYKLSAPKTEIFYDAHKGDTYLKNCRYPKIVKRSYGASNYGGYYVHKVNNYTQAKKLFETKKYHPMYIQDAIDLKDGGDLRVMLIGHKPICAFWRYSGEGAWITNTSQGGSMSYENVPMNALELAVKASKAAKAEYWACDIAIDAKNGKPYILECATAFAAFPYIRDWIGQYLMWDFSNGRFKKPHIPLFSWEELGKIDSSLLRTMRHIGFGRYKPSTDGAYYYNSKEENFNMELTQESLASDLPDVIPPMDELGLPHAVLEETKKGEQNLATLDDSEELDLHHLSLTDLMSLHGMEEDIAIAIVEYSKQHNIKHLNELLSIEGISKQDLIIWGEKLSSSVNINTAKAGKLKLVEAISDSLADTIVAYRNEHGPFQKLTDLMQVKGIGQKRFEKMLDLVRLK